MSSSTRVPIPPKVQNEILLANRHACCVCQKRRVQLHHVDGNPANNSPANIAALCLDHHDMASMQIGLTKKLRADQVTAYKAQWEAKCKSDIQALSRARFTFYYCIYKNPPRLREAYQSLAPAERVEAVERMRKSLLIEQDRKEQDTFFGLNAVPAVNPLTLEAMRSVFKGELYPSYLGNFTPHPADPSYSRDCSTREAMAAYHKYDLWCQVVAQTLAEARGTIPIEDLYRLTTEEELDDFSGRLVTFTLSVRGKGIHLPGYWEKYPVASIQARKTVDGRAFRTRMQIRTMYLFSDTAAENLRMGRISGLGLFNGATIDEEGAIDLTIVPMIIGSGGWNLHPEQYK